MVELLQSLALAALALAAVASAAVNPLAPGPGNSFREGAPCPMQYALDTTGLWSNMTIDLMTGPFHSLQPSSTLYSLRIRETEMVAIFEIRLKLRYGEALALRGWN